MNSFSDNFISYNELTIDFPDGLDLQEIPHSSPNTDSTCLYTNPVSPPYITHQDHLAFEMNNQEFTQPPSFYPTQDNEVVHDQLCVDYHKGVSEKSKRIQKRNAAKERVIIKKGIDPFFVGIDAQFLPEGYDDPNLDERTKKKMIQMVRNRISAQTSRDRKKNHIYRLEEQNRQLEEQKLSLIQEIGCFKEANDILHRENQSLKQSMLCSSCEKNLSDQHILPKADVNIEDSKDEILLDHGFSGLPSPRLGRFNSAGKGFLAFFAFATFLSIIVFVNFQQHGDFYREGSILSTRVLDTEGGSEYATSGNKDKYVNHLDMSSSLALNYMSQIKSQFNLNYEPTFKAHFRLHSLSSLNYTNIVNTHANFVKASNIYSVDPYPNALIEYDDFRGSNLRKKTPTLMSQKIPVIGYGESDSHRTATIFCPSGLEFFDNQNQLGSSEVGNNKNELDLQSAEYLQLLVPKSTITRHNARNTITDIYGMPVRSEGSEDEGLLEIWVKVFHMRDIQSIYN